MKEVIMFYLESCPFCHQALRIEEQLKHENKLYKDVKIRRIDEAKERVFCNQFDYYYVPAYYVDNKKVFEGVHKKEDIERVFKEALF